MKLFSCIEIEQAGRITRLFVYYVIIKIRNISDSKALFYISAEIYYNYNERGEIFVIWVL